MPINQPPISEDPIAAIWDLEATQLINQLEERLRTLLNAIQDAEDLADLKTKTKNL